MPKLYLKFDLDDPEDRNQATHAQQGETLWLAAQEFDQWLRNKAKYEDQEWAVEARQMLHDCFEGLI